MAYPIENLLRPPVEFIPTLVSIIVAPILLIWPQLFGLTWPFGLGLAILVLLHGVLRGLQAIRIVQYQKNVNTSRVYSLSPIELPSSKQKVFLGRGFRWSGIHTQRWVDLQRQFGAGSLVETNLQRFA